MRNSIINVQCTMFNVQCTIAVSCFVRHYACSARTDFQYSQQHKSNRIRTTTEQNTIVTYSPTYRGGGLLAQVQQPVQYQQAIPVCPTVLIFVLCQCYSHAFISYVYSSVYISVMMCLTARTNPFSDRQIFCFTILVSTSTANL